MTELTIRNKTDLPNILAGAERALAEATSVEEVRDIHDQLNKMKKVARDLRLTVVAINKIKAPMWRAERALGIWLNEVAPHGGNRIEGSKNTLCNLDISGRLSIRSRKMAKIHIEDLETFIENWDDTKELNQSFLLGLQTQSKTNSKEKCECPTCGNSHAKGIKK
jgi:hypothetical protein